MKGDLGLILGGGGARAAYQVGVLKGIAKRHPHLTPEILNGVSAGAINAAALANQTGNFRQRVDSLVELWSGLSVDQVFRSNASSLLWHGLKVALSALVFGGRKRSSEVSGLVDTAPLRELLENTLGVSTGQSLPGIARNLAQGTLKAVSLVGTHYKSGHTVTWYQGLQPADWDRPTRHGLRTDLRVEHVMASSALPLFFPAVEVDGSYFGDGGIRQHAPLAPAIHLGAERLLSISTRYGKSDATMRATPDEPNPQPAQIMGVLMNAIFLDVLDYDVANLQRINALVRALPTEQHAGLRDIEILSLRPSRDLGALAADYEPRLPGLFRFLTRRLGTKQVKSPDVLSLVMFQPDYLSRLIELGENDVEEREGEIAELLV